MFPLGNNRQSFLSKYCVAWIQIGKKHKDKALLHLHCVFIWFLISNFLLGEKIAKMNAIRIVGNYKYAKLLRETNHILKRFNFNLRLYRTDNRQTIGSKFDIHSSDFKVNLLCWLLYLLSLFKLNFKKIV